MATMVLERETLPEPLLSCFAVPRITATPRDGGVFLTPAVEVDGPDADYIDPADYPDTTAYLNAIPDMVESILESSNAPASAFHPARQESFCA